MISIMFGLLVSYILISIVTKICDVLGVVMKRMNDNERR